MVEKQNSFHIGKIGNTLEEAIEVALIISVQLEIPEC
jgi:hypothetical protein